MARCLKIELCNIAHSIRNFFSFSKHPSQVKFRLSVQILWKIDFYLKRLIFIDFLNIHKIWTDDRNLICKGCFEKEKKILIEWAMLRSSMLKHLAMVWLQSFWIDFIKKPRQGFFWGFLPAFSGGWGIIINYTEGSLNSVRSIAWLGYAFRRCVSLRHTSVFKFQRCNR